MEDEQSSAQSTAAAKDLLLADYKYRSESLWKNEQGGETRVNWFIGIVTAVVGALITLGAKENALPIESLQLIVLVALSGLMVLGLITFARMITRNEHTDQCKRGLDVIRQTFKDHFDPEGLLVDYYPIEFPSVGKEKKSGLLGELTQWWRNYGSEIRLRKFGGLAHTVAAINSLIVSGIVGTLAYSTLIEQEQTGDLRGLYGSAGLAFLLSLLAQLIYLTYREGRVKEKFGGYFSHAGGVVYKSENGFPQFLIVRPKNNAAEWVFPKGHIETGEGHGEAALREVREETGVFARLVCPLGNVGYQAQGEEVFAKFYLMERVFTGTANEVREMKWCSFDEAMQLLTHPETRYLLQEGQRRLDGG